VDVTGIARLHGVSIHTASRRKPPPWAEPEHPATLTGGPPAPGRPQLWDKEQADAYANGEPVPPLPQGEHPDDLLNDDEAAALAGLTPATWARYRRAGRVPKVDKVVCGADHWRRRTIEKYRDDRAQRANAPRGGRPQGSSEKLSRAELARRIRELIESGETNVAAIARQTGCAYTTALRHVRNLSPQ
jgi:hypothetical protein